MKNPGILIGYRNTMFIVVAGVIVNLLMTALGAYVLSRKNVIWNKAFMIIIVITMFFSLSSFMAFKLPMMTSAFRHRVTRTALSNETRSGLKISISRAPI